MPKTIPSRSSHSTRSLHALPDSSQELTSRRMVGRRLRVVLKIGCQPRAALLFAVTKER